MHDPTHAPGWRGRPRRFGPLVGMGEEPHQLERILYGTSAVLALVPIVVAAYVWGADLLAGHLPR